MLGELRTPQRAPLPKGLCKETLELWSRTLKHADAAQGAAEAAETSRA